MRNTQALGFTLIEILVVVVIVSILTVMGVQLISSGSVERNLQQQGRILQSSIEYSCDQAVLQNTPYGLMVSQAAYGFSIFTNQTWQEVIYQETSLDKILLDGSLFSLTLDGQTVVLEEELDSTPQIVCNTSGEISPFSLTLSDATEQHHYQLTTPDFLQIKGQWLDEKNQ
ncbi:MAG: GspH/FimT family pseudopilin [Proteobacteria bacterium]|nr:GspH/FimT family pseudopilin [Pseudomonadota bacterium]